MFQKYKDYYKDNSAGFWFKRKLYGWGWTPVKWQGWVVVLSYVFILAYMFKDIDGKSHSVSDTLIGIIAPFIVATGVLVYICYKKGESPRWQWGTRKEDCK